MTVTASWKPSSSGKFSRTHERKSYATGFDGRFEPVSLNRKWSTEVGPVTGLTYHETPNVLTVWVDPASAVGPVLNILAADDGEYRGTVETIGAVTSAEYHNLSGLLIVTTDRGYCQSVDPATGSARWETNASRPEADDGLGGSTHLYGGTDDMVYLYDGRSLAAHRVSDGSRRWTTELPEGTRNRMHTDRSVNDVYADSSPVMFEAGDGVYAINESDGCVEWRVRDRNPSVDTVVGSFVVVASDENWYVLDRKDRVVKAEYPAETPRAAGNGRLFVADESAVVAYELATNSEGAVGRSDPMGMSNATDTTHTTVYDRTRDDGQSDAASFCPQCGVDVTDTGDMNFCSACGTGLPDDANFCPECGADIDA